MGAITVIRILAALVAVRALTNFAKPVVGGDLVFFGVLLSGAPAAVLGVLIGAFMMAVVVAAWAKRRAALPLAIVYAFYATVNIVLFPIVTGLDALPPAMAGPLPYTAFALAGLAVSWGLVGLLYSVTGELS